MVAQSPEGLAYDLTREIAEDDRDNTQNDRDIIVML